jgi:hypothetical protein
MREDSDRDFRRGLNLELNEADGGSHLTITAISANMIERIGSKSGLGEMMQKFSV